VEVAGVEGRGGFSSTGVRVNGRRISTTTRRITVKMAGEKGVPPELELDAKWDACLDITLRRFVYSSVAGAGSALLLFRSPTTRWAAVAFGAGVGLGSAYTDCSRIFDGSLPKWPLPPNVSSPLSSSSSEDTAH